MPLKIKNMKTNLITNKNTKKPVVSVIIPVFNGAHFLEETVRSVQKSTYKRFEILLVDDGSTDHSKKVCKKLTKRYHNVRFYNFPRNRGLGRVLNFALARARGEFICRINQDDLMHPDRIALQTAYLQKRADIVAVGSSVKLFTQEGMQKTIRYLTTDDEIRKTWLVVSPFADPAVMYRKKTALDVGGYDQKYWPADDIHLWYRMGKIGKLANLYRPLTHMRIHSKTASNLYFRTQIIRTYQVHRWAHEWITPAPITTQVFWIVQLLAGLTLPAGVIYQIYYFLKQAINTIHEWTMRLEKYRANSKMLKTVTAKPAKLRISGV